MLAEGRYFRLDGGRGSGAGLDVLDLGGPVVVHHVGHEVEVDDLPGEDVDAARNEGDAEADEEGSAKGDGAVGEVVAVGADAEVDEQRDEDDGGVADDEALVAVLEGVEEGEGRDHEDRGEDAGDKAEG